MLSLQECMDMSDLGEDEIELIVAHENVPQIVAAGIGNDLLRTSRGTHRLRQIILEALELAAASGNLDRERRLRVALARFAPHSLAKAWRDAVPLSLPDTPETGRISLSPIRSREKSRVGINSRGTHPCTARSW